MIQERDPLAKAIQGNALIVSVHSRIIVIGERKWIQAIGLNFVEAKAGGVGRRGGKKGKSYSPGKILWGDALDGFVQRARDVGRRRVFAGIRGKLELNLR